ncbi:MAG TPA: hypothetical protein VNH83_28265 [Bryobacteraceae bacterium]|nr:hypothetical protein [Bryobacteraceae bacterium]
MSMLLLLFMLQDGPRLAVNPGEIARLQSRGDVQVFGEMSQSAKEKYDAERKACDDKKSEFCFTSPYSMGPLLCRLTADDELILSEGVTAAQCIRKIVEYSREASMRNYKQCEADKRLIFDTWKKSNDETIQILSPKKKVKP